MCESIVLPISVWGRRSITPRHMYIHIYNEHRRVNCEGRAWGSLRNWWRTQPLERYVSAYACVNESQIYLPLRTTDCVIALSYTIEIGCTFLQIQITRAEIIKGRHKYGGIEIVSWTHATFSNHSMFFSNKHVAMFYGSWIWCPLRIELCTMENWKALPWSEVAP